MAYFLCTAQPELPETRDEDYCGGFLTVPEKKKVINTFTKDKEHIPLTMGHASDKTFGAIVAKDECVGKVLDLFLDRDGDLVAKCILEMDNEEAYRTVLQDIVKNKKGWGVSVCIEWSMPGGFEAGGPSFKQFTHLALTQQPYLGEQGAYIHHIAFDEKTIDKRIATDYYKEGVGHCYASDALLERIGVKKIQVEPQRPLPTHPIPTTKTNDTDTSSAHHLQQMSNAMTDNTAASTVNHQPSPSSSTSGSTEFAGSNAADSNVAAQQQQQQQDQQASDAQRQICFKELSDMMNNGETTPNGKGGGGGVVEGKSLSAINAELNTFRAKLSKAGLRAEDCPDAMQEYYFGLLKGSNAGKAMLKEYVSSSVGVSNFTEDDAKKFHSLIDGNADYNQKKPFLAKLEASYTTFKRSEEEKNLALKRNRVLEDEKSVLVNEKNAAMEELESFRKKAKLNEYTPFNHNSTSSYSQPPQSQTSFSGNNNNNQHLSKQSTTAAANKEFDLFGGLVNSDAASSNEKTNSNRLDGFPLEEFWHGMHSNQRVKDSHSTFLGFLSSTSTM